MSEEKHYIYDGAIVLDIDSTLLYTRNKPPADGDLDFMKQAKYMPLRERIYHMKVKIYDRDKNGNITNPEAEDFEFWGCLRPYCKQFLVFCHRYFKHVIIWSAGHYDYVHAVVDEIFKGLHFRPDMIYTHLETIIDDNVGSLKPLAKIINDNKHLGLSLKNMVIVDDLNNNFETVNYSNGIEIPAYRPKKSADDMLEEDKRLLQIAQMIIARDLHEYDDIRSLDLKSTFNFTTEEYNKFLEDKLY